MYIRVSGVVFGIILLGSTVSLIAQTSTPPPSTPSEAYLKLQSSYRDFLNRSAHPSREISTELLQQADVQQRLLARRYISIFAGKKWSGRDSLALARLYLAADDSGSAIVLIQQQLHEYRGDDYQEACSILLAAFIEQRQLERARSLAIQLMENASLSNEADLYIGKLIRNLKDEDIQQSMILAQKRFSILSQRAPAAIPQRIMVAERAEELGNLYIEAGRPDTAKKLFAEQLNSLRAAARGLSPNTNEYDELTERIHFTDRLLSAAQRRAELSGAAAPKLIGEDFLDMNASDLANHTDTMVLLDFFAHSCAPCVAELEDIDHLTEKYKGKLSAFVVTSYRGYFGRQEEISRSDEKAALKHLKKEKGSKAGLLIGPASNFNQYGIVTLPAFALIDAAGRVRSILIGATIGELQVAIEKLLKEEAQRN